MNIVDTDALICKNSIASTEANSHCGLSSVPYWMRTPLKLSQNLMRRVVCSSSWQPDCRNPMKMVA